MKPDGTLKIDAVRALMDAIDEGIGFAFNGRAEKYLDRPKVWREAHDKWFDEYNRLLRDRVEDEIKSAIYGRLEIDDESSDENRDAEILELRSTVNWILAQMRIEKPERLVKFRDEICRDDDFDWEHKE